MKTLAKLAVWVALTLAVLPLVEAQSVRQRQLLDDDWRFSLNTNSSSATTNGTPVVQWVWIADDNAPGDAGTMAASGLDTSSWTSVTVGTDVFNGRLGYAWFRAAITNLASSLRPLTLYFLSVDDNATVYLNGHLLGQHTGWSDPFGLSMDSAWIVGGTNVLAVAVQNTGGPGGIYGGVFVESGPPVPPPGISLTQWLCLADDNAPNDVTAMTATNLDTSGWQIVTNGQDVFNGHVGYAWFRTSLDAVATAGRPLKLHFLCADDNASVYLNGVLLGQHTGASQPFDISPLDYAWVNGGPNVLSVAVQNTGGPGGILGPVSLQSGTDVSPSQSGTNSQDPTAPGFDDSAWRIVHLPHDYVVEGTFTNTADAGHASLPVTTAWYRKKFVVPASAQGQSVWIDFDGVYHNSKVWINGNYLGNWWSGYASFRYDISQFAIPGGTNVLSVYVDPTVFEGWWYEGGGIYRHVWLNIANPLHVAPWGTFVAASVSGPDTNGNASANLTITTTLTNAAAQTQSCTLVSQVTGPDGVPAGTVTTTVLVPGALSTNVVQTMAVTNARLWSLETPQLYRLHTAIQENRQAVDNVDTSFGIRSIYFDVNNGFFLNGKHVELNGTCNHQDFAGVGTGMPDNLLYWRIKKLKEMGSNAYRCSHNPPTEALLDACDRLGMLVMDETRHLGDATGAKSDASTPYSDLSELNSMILRDRNHPSIIIWSMCNEEFAVQATQAGANIFYAMKNRVLQFDTTRPISCAMNGGTGYGISLVEDLQGFNYNPGTYDSFHQSFPLEPAYGSETTSAETDRGTYTNDGVAYVSAYSTTPENSLQPVATRPYMAGGFIWTGFDYKGEPSPYGWPCISSKFGVMDSCGLPKDDYYYYQAWWGNHPLVYLFPHWNWSAGQTVTVWCYGNTAGVELFLNGVSQGKQTMPAYGHVAWSVPYSPGTLLAKGYDAGGNVVATNQVVTTGVPAALKLTTDRTTLTADGEDVTVVYASVLDSLGQVVPTATNLVTFSVQAPAYIAGVGNGDPASHEPDKAAKRQAFNGWCMVLVGVTNPASAMRLTATAAGLTTATLNLQALSITSPPVTPGGLSAIAGNATVNLAWPISFGATSYNIKRANTSGGPYTTVANYTALTVTDNSVTNGYAYYYVVSAVNTNGESTNSVEVSATPSATAVPAAPTGLMALPDDGQAGLAWNVSTGASSYNIKRSTSSSGPFLTIASSATTYYTDAGLANGATYFYVVSAVVNGVESPASLPVGVTPASLSYLVGTIIGTTGSWNNSGNTREKVSDGNVNTFFDAPTGDNDWVGLDLGTNAAQAISKISFYPRIGYAGRMVGGVFQGANVSDFSDAVTLFNVTSQPTDSAWTTVLNSNRNAFRYLRYLSPPNGYGNIAEVGFYTPGPEISLAGGTTIGSTGSSTNTSDKVFDGDLTTFFDASSAYGNWVGLDFGYPRVVSSVRYCPRSTFGNRMLNGVFQGANTPGFGDATNLFTITNVSPDLTLSAQTINNTDTFRYVRYLSPAGSYGDVAELQFFSSTPATPALPAVPTGLATTAGDRLVGLSWNASSGAVSYNVKRATVSGGPYTNIASRTATVHMDSGLASGTYYYVVSAVNAAGESSNSTEASAQLTCSTPTAPTGLAVSAGNGQFIVAWSPVSDVLGYNVLRATNSQGPFSILAAGITGTTYVDTTITNKAIYYYTVQAVNACGPSASSTSVSASLALLNVTPVLAPIPNQTLVAGQILWLTNAATDADSPPQSLTFGLSSPPSGAAINPGNGILNWRPTIAQGGTTNVLLVTVSDNGEPVLSATQNVTVTVRLPVQPSFGQWSLTNGLFRSWIFGDFGPDYAIFSSTNLAQWELVSNNAQPAMPFVFMDSGIANHPQRYFRVSLGP